MCTKYYSKDILEHFEIIYLDMLCQQFDQLIEDCVVLNCGCNGMEELLQVLEVDKLTSKEEAEFLWIKCKSVSSTDKDFLR